jgi:hypothetical protein
VVHGLEVARCGHCSLASSADSTARPNPVTMSRKPSRSIRPLTISHDRVLAPLPGALVPVARQNNVMRCAASSSAAIVCGVWVAFFAMLPH